MAFADRFAFEQELQDLDGRTRRADRGPTEKQRLGRFTIAFLIINRTVGSGIFVTPAKILRGTDSVGLSLILWLVGGIFALSGVFLWLEFGLSTPRHVVRGEKTAVPRSGGEKNYVRSTALLGAADPAADHCTPARIRLSDPRTAHNVHVRHSLYSSG